MFPDISACPKLMWTEVFWKFLHTTALYALHYHEPDASRLTEGFKGLEVFIPCTTCKKHYRDFCETHSLTQYIEQDIKYGVFTWTVDLHNYVNNQLGVQEVTYMQALSEWANHK